MPHDLPMVYWEPMETAERDASKRVLIWTGQEPDPIEIGQYAASDNDEMGMAGSEETWTDSGRPAIYWRPLPHDPSEVVLKALAQRRELMKVVTETQARLAAAEAEIKSLSEEDS